MDEQALQRVWSNRQRRRRVRAVGEAAWDVAAALDVGEAQQLALLKQLWRRTVPRHYVRKGRLQGLRGGSVRIIVTDASCRFLVERVVGPAFIRAAQGAFPGWGLTDVRVELEESGGR